MPKRDVRRRHRSVPASLMAVPEAPMNQNNRSELRKDEVWSSWQITAMQPKSIPGGVREASDCQLGPRVLSADASHHSTARFYVDYINRDMSACFC
jgi:hypothetical protein